ncbi:MAG: FliO/MopB family protein [Alphaproteobacteria bacterium]
MNIWYCLLMEIITFAQIAQLIVTLALVVGLMGGLALLIKKLGLAHSAPVNKTQKRLKIIESQPLDARRRLVLVQCDDKQHLVMLGINGDTIIKTDIEPDKPDENERKENPANI